jgi:hypothetical protein
MAEYVHMGAGMSVSLPPVFKKWKWCHDVGGYFK